MKKQNCKFKVILSPKPRPVRDCHIVMAHNSNGLDDAEIDDNGDLTEISYDYTIFGSCCRFEYSFRANSHPTHFSRHEAYEFIKSIPETFNISEPLRGEMFHPIFKGILV